MKTVIDAINQSKGTIRDGINYIYVGSKHNKQYGNVLDFTMDEVDNSKWDFICTTNEFNQCVDEMETNFGISQKYSEYKKGFRAITEINFGAKAEPSKPLYTKEMCDAGELPSVGISVMTPWGKAKVELIYMHQICCSNEYGIGVNELDEIKPLTPLI